MVPSISRGRIEDRALYARWATRSFSHEVGRRPHHPPRTKFPGTSKDIYCPIGTSLLPHRPHPRYTQHFSSIDQPQPTPIIPNRHGIDAQPPVLLPATRPLPHKNPRAFPTLNPQRHLDARPLHHHPPLAPCLLTHRMLGHGVRAAAAALHAQWLAARARLHALRPLWESRLYIRGEGVSGTQRLHVRAGESECGGDGGLCGVFVGGVEVWGGGEEGCGGRMGGRGVFGGVCVERYDG